MPLHDLGFCWWVLEPFWSPMKGKTKRILSPDSQGIFDKSFIQVTSFSSEWSDKNSFEVIDPDFLGIRILNTKQQSNKYSLSNIFVNKQKTAFTLYRYPCNQAIVKVVPYYCTSFYGDVLVLFNVSSTP